MDPSFSMPKYTWALFDMYPWIILSAKFSIALIRGTLNSKKKVWLLLNDKLEIMKETYELAGRDTKH